MIITIFKIKRQWQARQDRYQTFSIFLYTSSPIHFQCIIAPDDTDCKVLYEEMRKWVPGNKAPKAVLSLTGGSAHFLNNETLASRLKSGLLDLITTTSKIECCIPTLSLSISLFLSYLLDTCTYILWLFIEYIWIQEYLSLRRKQKILYTLRGNIVFLHQKASLS